MAPQTNACSLTSLTLLMMVENNSEMQMWFVAGMLLFVALGFVIAHLIIFIAMMVHRFNKK